MLMQTRTDKMVVAAGSAVFAGALILAFALQYKFGEVIFVKRIIAGIAGCF